MRTMIKLFLFFLKRKRKAKSKSKESSSFEQVEEYISRFSGIEERDGELREIGIFNHVVKKERIIEFNSNSDENLYEVIEKYLRDHQPPVPNPPPEKKEKSDFWNKMILPAIVVVTVLLELLSNLLVFLSELPRIVDLFPVLISP